MKREGGGKSFSHAEGEWAQNVLGEFLHSSPVSTPPLLKRLFTAANTCSTA